MTRPFGFSDTLFESANAELARRCAAQSRTMGRTITPPVFGETGASETRLNAVEAELGFVLPDDLRYLAGHTADPDGHLFSWIDRPVAIAEFREQVFEGICADISASLFWLTRWGERPDDASQRLAVFEEDFRSWPQLVPVHAHRALVVDPPDDGNPVFSIMQTDIICYGCTLADWMALEFTRGSGAYEDCVDLGKLRSIPVWSEFALNAPGFIAQSGLYPEDEAAVQALMDRVRAKRNNKD